MPVGIKHLVAPARPFYYKFMRVLRPPLQKPRESPYIVGPHLKPAYYPTEYITEPIKEKHDDDLDYFIYRPIKVMYDESRTVKLLLLEDVEGLGVAGQIVDAPYRLGSSKLIAMKKAEYATDFARKWYKFGPKSHLSASSALSPRTIRLLKSQVFNLPVSKGVSIEPWHISLALRLAGCTCPKEAIENIEEGDTVKCTIRINNHERVEVKFVQGALNIDN